MTVSFPVHFDENGIQHLFIYLVKSEKKHKHNHTIQKDQHVACEKDTKTLFIYLKTNKLNMNKTIDILTKIYRNILTILEFSMFHASFLCFIIVC